MNNSIAILAGLGLSVMTAGTVNAEIFDDGQNVGYYETMKGKTVVFVPPATGLDNVEGYITAMRRPPAPPP